MRHKDYRRTNRALLRPARLKLLFHFWLLSSAVLSALSPVIAQRFSLEEWADETRATIDTVDDADLAEDTRFNAPVYLDLPGKDVEVGTREDRERIAQTVALYQALIGHDTIRPFVDRRGIREPPHAGRAVPLELLAGSRPVQPREPPKAHRHLDPARHREPPDRNVEPRDRPD